jgi:hypothetical protein
MASALPHPPATSFYAFIQPLFPAPSSSGRLLDWWDWWPLLKHTSKLSQPLCVCVYVCMWRERERERQRKRKRERERESKRESLKGRCHLGLAFKAKPWIGCSYMCLSGPSQPSDSWQITKHCICFILLSFMVLYYSAIDKQNNSHQIWTKTCMSQTSPGHLHACDSL